MDKNKIIGVLFLVAALGLMFYPGTRPRPSPPPPASPTPGETADGTAVPPAPELGPAGPEEAGPPLQLQGATSTDNSLFAPVQEPRPDDTYVALANEFIEVRFTPYGGAIAEVALRKRQYRAHKDDDAPYVLNAVRHAPILAISGLAGAGMETRYELVSQSATQIVWRTRLRDAVEITRTYTLGGGRTNDPYVIRQETTVRNLGGNALAGAELGLNLGTARLVDRNDTGQHLNIDAYNGDDVTFVGTGGFSPNWISRTFFNNTVVKPAIAVEQPAVWAAAKNQFFATIVVPDEPGKAVVARRVELPSLADSPRPEIAMTGELRLDLPALAPAASATLGADLYAGPKEYSRLLDLGQREDLIMQWGWFGFFSKLLLWLLKHLHAVFSTFTGGAWGFAIIATTVLLRTAMWPVTAAGTRSAKRMAKIQVPLKAIQEKYKDNRQKQQQETLRLFKEHKVNPVGGCLPVFIQIPIFFGLFRMLQSASELRFAEFLWIPDLSAPEHLWYLGSFPINIMPLLMGATQVVQMRMTPTPTTDNASAKMMKFMPYFITFICYNFSSGLALYWTASNAFSIFQQWVTNRSKDPADLPPAASPGAAERAKPVRDARVASVGKGRKKP